MNPAHLHAVPPRQAGIDDDGAPCVNCGRIPKGKTRTSGFRRGKCGSCRNYFRQHGHDRPILTREEQFWAKVDASGDCWEWTGVCDPRGYGRTTVNYVQIMTYRYAYELLVGPIPRGLTLDHLCRNPRCCNPDHLEPCTGAKNTLRGNTITGINARKTHCIHGHEFTPENTRITVDGWRDCRTCRRAWNRGERPQ